MYPVAQLVSHTAGLFLKQLIDKPDFFKARTNKSGTGVKYNLPVIIKNIKKAGLPDASAPQRIQHDSVGGNIL